MVDFHERSMTFYLLSDGNRVDMGLIQAIAKLIDSCSDLLLGGVNIRALAVRCLFFSWRDTRVEKKTRSCCLPYQMPHALSFHLIEMDRFSMYWSTCNDKNSYLFCIRTSLSRIYKRVLLKCVVYGMVLGLSRRGSKWIEPCHKKLEQERGKSCKEKHQLHLFAFVSQAEIPQHQMESRHIQHQALGNELAISVKRTVCQWATLLLRAWSSEHHDVVPLLTMAIDSDQTRDRAGGKCELV